jgi:hypothetical protein
MIFSPRSLPHLIGQVALTGAVIIVLFMLIEWFKAIKPMVATLDTTAQTLRTIIPKGLLKKKVTRDQLRRWLNQLPGNEIRRLDLALEMEPQIHAARSMSRRVLRVIMTQICLWSASLTLLYLTDVNGWSAIAAVCLFASSLCYGFTAGGTLLIDTVEKITMSQKLIMQHKALASRVEFDADEFVEAGTSLLLSAKKMLPVHPARGQKAQVLGLLWYLGVITSSILTLTKINPAWWIMTSAASILAGFAVMKRLKYSIKRIKFVNDRCKRFERLIDKYQPTKGLNSIVFDLQYADTAIKSAARASHRSIITLISSSCFTTILLFVSILKGPFTVNTRLTLAMALVLALRSFLSDNGIRTLTTQSKMVSSKLDHIGYLMDREPATAIIVVKKSDKPDQYQEGVN